MGQRIKICQSVHSQGWSQSLIRWVASLLLPNQTGHNDLNVPPVQQSVSFFLIILGIWPIVRLYPWNWEFGKIGNFFIKNMLLWYLDIKPGLNVSVKRRLRVREITVLFIFSSFFSLNYSFYFWLGIFIEKLGEKQKRSYCKLL